MKIDLFITSAKDVMFGGMADLDKKADPDSWYLLLCIFNSILYVNLNVGKVHVQLIYVKVKKTNLKNVMFC